MNAKEQQGDLLLYVHYCRKWLEEKVKRGLEAGEREK